jgi:hypothetical protein
MKFSSTHGRRPLDVDGVGEDFRWLVTPPPHPISPLDSF